MLLVSPLLRGRSPQSWDSIAGLWHVRAEGIPCEGGPRASAVTADAGAAPGAGSCCFPWTQGWGRRALCPPAAPDTASSVSRVTGRHTLRGGGVPVNPWSHSERPSGQRSGRSVFTKERGRPVGSAVWKLRAVWKALSSRKGKVGGTRGQGQGSSVTECRNQEVTEGTADRIPGVVATPALHLAVNCPAPGFGLSRVEVAKDGRLSLLQLRRHSR